MVQTTRQTRATTREPNLLRNTASGEYYGRFTPGGKQKWFSLVTDVWTVAETRVVYERAKIERLRRTAEGVTAGDAHMGVNEQYPEHRPRDPVSPPCAAAPPTSR